MPTTSLLTVAVAILSETEDTLTLQPIDSIADCPRCATGQGCGQNPWFRGIFGKQPLTLPRPADFPHAQTGAELSLPHYLLTYLTMTTYALPLAAFIITLAFCQSFPQWLQFIIALAATAMTFLLTKKHQTTLLKQHLQLHPIPQSVEPQRA